MKKISVSRKIHGELKIVWNLFSNFDLVYKFHPMVKTSPLEGHSNNSKGSQRVCSMYNGMKAKEVISSYDEYKYLKIEVTESPMPFSTAYGDFYFKKIDSNTTEITIEMWLKPKFGILGDLMFKLMMKQKLTGMLNGVLKGLDDYLVTGRLIGKNGVLLDKDPSYNTFAQSLSGKVV